MKAARVLAQVAVLRGCASPEWGWARRVVGGARVQLTFRGSRPMWVPAGVCRTLGAASFVTASEGCPDPSAGP